MRTYAAAAIAATVSIATAGVADASQHDPALDKELFVGDITLSGGESIGFEFPKETDDPGFGLQIVGITFEGVYNGPSAFAGDLKMEMFFSSGSFYDVGGFDNPSPNDWDFGSFTGAGPDLFLTHSDFKNFNPSSGPDGTTIKGDFIGLALTLDWDSSPGHQWKDVRVTLHKVPSPGPVALMAMAGLAAMRRRR